MLIDTDVLVWHLRGNERARRVIEAQRGLSMSVVTYIELVQGMRDKEELIRLRKAVRQWNARILYVTEDISARAMFYVERYYLSRSLQLADALICATVVVNSLELLTGNERHYRGIEGVKVVKFKP